MKHPIAIFRTAAVLPGDETEAAAPDWLSLSPAEINPCLSGLHRFLKPVGGFNQQ